MRARSTPSEFTPRTALTWWRVTGCLYATIARVSSAAFVSRAWRDDSTNCSTTGAVSGCVYRRHPPATLRSSRPDPRSLEVTLELIAQRLGVAATDAEGLGEHRGREWLVGDEEQRFQSACVSRRCGPVVAIAHRSHASRRPRDIDVAEGLRLRELDLPFTVQLQDRQEPHDHMDPLVAVGDQVPERRPRPMP